MKRTTKPADEATADKPEPMARELDPRAYEPATDKPIKVRTLYSSTASPTGSTNTRGATQLSTGTTDKGA